jgi:di/tricarboxylate transporter
MAVTGFLSMWLANIATTAMMIPIAAAVLEALDTHRKHLRELKRKGLIG